MHISLILPNPDDACSLYRAHPWRSLEGVTTKTYSGKEGFSLWEAILTANVVLMQRPYTAQQLSIARIVKQVGKKLIIDWDDNLSLVPPWNPQKRAFDGCLPHLKELAELSDCVTVSSKALYSTAMVWGAKRVHMIPNAIDDTFKNLPKFETRHKKVIWRGSNTHSADLDVGRGKLRELNKTHKIIFVGDMPTFAYELEHEHIPVSDYCAYMCSMNALAAEYMYVPLVNHAFNHAKSDIAAQECYAIGAKLLHNNVGEFLHLPETAEPRWLSSVQHLRLDALSNL